MQSMTVMLHIGSIALATGGELTIGQVGDEIEIGSHS